MNPSRIPTLLLACMVAGCGGPVAKQPKLESVRGTVTLDAKPVSGVMLSFVPQGATRGFGASGYTDRNGKYSLITRFGDEGILAGQYVVTAAKLVMPDGSDFPLESKVAPIDSPATQILPAKYNDVTRSILKATVQEGLNTIDFQLLSR